MDVILHANPHRVFISRVGRVEVFEQGPACNGKSPNGPHTRILPELIAHQRTHAATEALPGNWVPCAHFHPPKPAQNNQGRSQPFDAESHFAFLRLLEKYSDGERFALKKRLIHTVIAQHEPFAIHNDNDPFSRATVLVTLRQLQAMKIQSATLAAWLTEYDCTEKRLDEPAKELPRSLLDMLHARAK